MQLPQGVVGGIAGGLTVLVLGGASYIVVQSQSVHKPVAAASPLATLSPVASASPSTVASPVAKPTVKPSTAPAPKPVATRPPPTAAPRAPARVQKLNWKQSYCSANNVDASCALGTGVFQKTFTQTADTLRITWNIKCLEGRITISVAGWSQIGGQAFAPSQFPTNGYLSKTLSSKQGTYTITVSNPDEYWTAADSKNYCTIEITVDA